MAPLSLERSAKSPRDAVVTIDEEYIGPLGYVAARGVKLPAGKHRITVEKPGYFPWDRLVEADREPIQLNIELEPIPRLNPDLLPSAQTRPTPRKLGRIPSRLFSL